MINLKNEQQINMLIAFFLLVVLTFIIYGNTLNSSWHLDDYDNITENSKLHMENLQLTSIVQSFFAKPHSNIENPKLYRPVACLTFAFNWYFGKDNVLGYHLVNISIHIMTAFFLFLFILNIFDAPVLKKQTYGDKYFVALLASSLWVIHPIQVQAVTYIVQRMASLATMFYILGLYFYLKGRYFKELKAFIHYSAVFICFFFAVGSKENAITLPLSIVLIEIIFYHDLDSLKKRPGFIILSLIACVTFTFAVGVVFFLNGKPLQILDGYSGRSFTFIERLLTEPRIIMGYLSKIFYPIASRFSIEYDINVSTSLFEPWTTFPSIIAISGSIALSLFFLKKRPFISFAILFFFLNHIIESSIIPLELVFDHRNYLPSLFLFLPVSIGVQKIISVYKNKNMIFYSIFIAFMILLLIGLGLGTYTWNMAWINEKALWVNASNKAPFRSRTAQNLAKYYYFKMGDIDNAIGLYQKSMGLKDAKPKYSKFSALKNIAGLYYQKKEYQRALFYINKATEIYPEAGDAHFKKVLILVQLGKFNDAKKNIDLLLSKYEKNETYSLMKGRILLLMGQHIKSIKYFRISLKKNPYNYDTNIYLGAALSLLGEYEKADTRLKTAFKIQPGNMQPLLGLIENSYRSGNDFRLDLYTSNLLSNFTVGQIEKELMKLNRDNLTLKLSKKILYHAIFTKLPTN